MKYVYTIGTEGSAFHRKTELDISRLPSNMGWLARFFKANPDSHDVCWYVGKETHIVKRLQETGRAESEAVLEVRKEA